MNNTRFWMVIMDNVVSVRYKSKTEANNEAKRLADKNNGSAVYVLEATHYYQVTAPEPTLFSTADE